MKTNQAGIDLIKSFEGCKLTAYQDIVGVWTIGYGHIGVDASPGRTVTQEQADTLLQSDLDGTEQAVANLLEVEVTGNMFSALVSFAYNLGAARLAQSTLLKKLNAGDFAGAGDEFLKWDRAGGVVVPGLLRRRQAERELFLKSDSETT